MASTVGDLARILSDDGRNDEIPTMLATYEFAERAHRGQRRRNGDRYITHPIEVATMVARGGGSGEVVCAALLHDVVEDAGVPATQVRRHAGAEIAAMIESTAGVEASNDDVRLLAIADRLHNLRTIKPISADRRRAISLDTLTRHVPAARELNQPELMTELTLHACALLDAPNGQRRLRISISTLDPRLAFEAVAAVSSSVALIDNGTVPELLFAAGGAGAFTLLAAALFGRNPQAAERLRQLVTAWRRDH